VSLGLAAGLQWRAGCEAETGLFDEIGRNLQDIFSNHKVEADRTNVMEDDSLAGLMMRIEEGTCVDALDEEESDCSSMSSDSDFIILDEDTNINSCIQELDNCGEMLEITLEPISSTALLRELLETVEQQYTELCSLHEAEARTNSLLNALREAVQGSVEAIDADAQQALELLSEQDLTSVEAWDAVDCEDIPTVVGLIDRQGRALAGVRERVAWQHRLLKQMMGRVQVQPANTNPVPFCKRDAVYLAPDTRSSFEFVG
jgi:hypothetical protein